MPLQQISPEFDQCVAELNGTISRCGKEYSFTPLGASEAVPVPLMAEKVQKKVVLGEPIRVGGWPRFKPNGELQVIQILYCCKSATTEEPSIIAVQGMARWDSKRILITPQAKGKGTATRKFWVEIPGADLIHGIRYRIEATLDVALLRVLSIEAIGGKAIEHPERPPAHEPKPKPIKGSKPKKMDLASKPKLKPKAVEPATPGKQPKAVLAKGKHKVEIR